MRLQGRVEGDRQEIRQNLLADFLREGLAFAFIFLSVAFDAMAEDLVEENARRAAGKNGGADKRLSDRGFQQDLRRGSQPS